MIKEEVKGCYTQRGGVRARYGKGRVTGQGAYYDYTVLLHGAYYTYRRGGRTRYGT